MYNVIKSIHLEITDKCQALCPMCPRTNPNTGRQYNWIKKIDLNLEKIRKIFPERFLYTVEKIVIGGNFGDPFANKFLIDIVDYLFSCNPKIYIRISTNGSFYNKDWWFNLGLKFKKYNLKIVFAIEGIDNESHSFYRQSTNYQKVYENSKFFIKGGGNASALCLVFNHNEKLIEQIKKKNNVIGLNTTFLATERFWLEENLEFKSNNKILTLQKTKLNLDNNNSNIEKTINKNENIICFAEEDQHIYVDCNGYVSPCCFLGAALYIAHNNKFDIVNSNFGKYYTDILELKYIYEKYDLKLFDATVYSIETIINSLFFKNLKILHRHKKPIKCLRTCGNTPFKKI